jgi:histidyl-tRNA synthetase
VPKKIKTKNKKPAKIVKKEKTIKSAPVNKTEQSPKEKKSKAPRSFQTLRGMKDILTSENKYWEYIKNKAQNFALNYGYELIETPILEETALFKRAVGDETDIVSKEMFSFIDQGGENVCLRPEGTASIVRAYVQHGMVNMPQPVKFFYFGPMFRYDRPQAGRLRMFRQIGLEAIGEESPITDAEIIFFVYNFLKDLGLKINIEINSIGCPKCRESYKTKLVNYYRDRKSGLCEDCQKRLAKNPLRLLDCKEEKCQEYKEDAPQIVDWLCDECKNHFVGVLEYLDESGVTYNLNPRLVRGLDYYTKTVFEFFPENFGEEEKRQDALGGGGRYDGLVEYLGGRPTPACGVALGLERIILKMKESNIEIPALRKPDIFLAQLGEQARKKSFILIEELRKSGFYVIHSFSKKGLKKQLELANRDGVKYTLILGQKEVIDGTIIVREMEGGAQEIVDFNKTVQEMKKKIILP